MTSSVLLYDIDVLEKTKWNLEPKVTFCSLLFHSMQRYLESWESATFKQNKNSKIGIVPALLLNLQFKDRRNTVRITVDTCVKMIELLFTRAAFRMHQTKLQFVFVKK